jgi:HAD superfamily hydrolase (TIGR01549 family)
MIKAVIFDFDDTLVESRVVKWAHHKYVAKKFYNIDVTDEEIRKHWGKPIPILMSELYKNADTEEKMYEALISVREDFRKKVYPGAVDLLKALLENGKKIGVLSATNKRFLVEDLKDYGFPVEQMIIQGADETKVHKPDPEVFDLILGKFKKEGIQKEEIVYVGDSMDDLTASRGAGISFIAVTTGLYSKGDFEQKKVKNIGSSVNEVLEFIV